MSYCHRFFFVCICLLRGHFYPLTPALSPTKNVGEREFSDCPLTPFLGRGKFQIALSPLSWGRRGISDCPLTPFLGKEGNFRLPSHPSLGKEGKFRLPSHPFLGEGGKF